ncbi:MAG: hypothetical protein AAGK14_11980 [Verrucomicrobiota bacterium]
MSRRQKKQNNSRYWMVSGTLHLLVLIGILLSPVGQTIFHKDRPMKPEIVMDEEDLADTIDDIRNLAVERLRYQVELLSAGRERMSTNFQTMNEHYQPFVSDQVATARDRIVQEIDKLQVLQEEILAAAQRAVEQGAGGTDPMWRTYDRNRAGIVTGQEELRRAVMLTAADQHELVDLQIAAEEAQMSAFESLQDSVSAQNHLWREAQTRERYEGRIKGYQGSIRMFTDRIFNGEKNQPTLKQELKDAEKKLVEVKQSLEAAQAAYDEGKGSDQEKGLKKDLDRAKRSMSLAERGHKRAQSRLEKNQKDLVRNNARLEDAMQRLSNYRSEYDKYQKGLPHVLTRREQGAADVVRLQQKAIDDQQNVYDQLLVLLNERVEQAEAEQEQAGEAAPAAPPLGGGET